MDITGDITLEWQGSEVGRVEWLSPDSVRVWLSAGCARRHVAQCPGRYHDGHLRPLAVTLEGARLTMLLGGMTEAVGMLVEGALHHAGEVHRRLAWPFALQGALVAELVFRNGTALRIEATSASSRGDGDCAFHESLAC